MELGDLLFERHPKTFIHPRLKGKGMRPLKIGIDKDNSDRNVTKGYRPASGTSPSGALQRAPGAVDTAKPRGPWA